MHNTFSSFPCYPWCSTRCCWRRQCWICPWSPAGGLGSSLQWSWCRRWCPHTRAGCWPDRSASHWARCWCSASSVRSYRRQGWRWFCRNPYFFTSTLSLCDLPPNRACLIYLFYCSMSRRKYWKLWSPFFLSPYSRFIRSITHWPPPPGRFSSDLFHSNHNQIFNSKLFFCGSRCAQSECSTRPLFPQSWDGCGRTPRRSWIRGHPGRQKQIDDNARKWGSRCRWNSSWGPGPYLGRSGWKVQGRFQCCLKCPCKCYIAQK